MKKSIALSLSIGFLFLACSNSLDTNLVKKYENHLNTQVKDILNDIPKELNIRAEISNFSCKSEGKFIKCSSPNFNIFAKDITQTEQKILEAKNLELYSNEIYTGKDEGLITLKDYYKNLLTDNQNIKTSFALQDIKLGEKVINDINAIVSKNDPKIKDYLNKLSANSYTILFTNSIFTKNNDYNDIFNIKIDSQDFKFDINLNFDYKQQLLDFLNQKGVKFNTNTFSIDGEGIEKLLSQEINQKELAQTIQENIILNNFKIDTSLDTKGIFESYIAIAKGGLEALKIQSQNEEQALLLDKALIVLNEITKTPVYKLNLEAMFKAVPLNKEDIIDTLEKLNINKQDFTQEFKKELATMMLGLMMLN